MLIVGFCRQDSQVGIAALAGTCHSYREVLSSEFGF